MLSPLKLFSLASVTAFSPESPPILLHKLNLGDFIHLIGYTGNFPIHIV